MKRTNWWDVFMPLIKRISTEDALTDLQFYLKHDRELYFTGMALVAAMYVVFTGVFTIIAVDLLIRQSNPYTSSIAINCIGFAFISTIGFCMVKNYLHLRKDYIELKELMGK